MPGARRAARRGEAGRQGDSGRGGRWAGRRPSSPARCASRLDRRARRRPREPDRAAQGGGERPARVRAFAPGVRRRRGYPRLRRQCLRAALRGRGRRSSGRQDARRGRLRRDRRRRRPSPQRARVVPVSRPPALTLTAGDNADPSLIALLERAGATRDLLAAVSLERYDLAGRMLRDEPARIGPDGRDTIALHVLVAKKNVEGVRWLIERGVDVNAKRVLWDCNHTALHITVEHGVIELTRLLLDAGADPNIRDDKYHA